MKEFGNKHFKGVVISFNKSTGWYHICYTDGDMEDMNENELNAVFYPHHTHDSSKVDDEEINSVEHMSVTAVDEMLIPLTKDVEEKVKSIILSSGNGHDIIATSKTDSVQRNSMSRLKPKVWLNDEVIHYFLILLGKRDQVLCKKLNRKRSHFFKSFFTSKLLDEYSYCYANVERWSNKVPGKDIFKLDKIICPVNIINSHWACAVIFVEEKHIQYYDSVWIWACNFKGFASIHGG